ncbi:polysaccharide deacetylase family protein [Brevibacillus ginsengisoli]|uniref:polysaccharide deacetylase family protein n=1 Tax=Brevibacillus ginsengisoli TaxID=363854 RepID=UPI003CF4224D
MKLIRNFRRYLLLAGLLYTIQFMASSFVAQAIASVSTETTNAAHPEGSVPVLMYHSISRQNNSLCIAPEQFERQLSNLLKHGYTPITASELISAWENGSELPTRPIVLTFDDGYKDNYTHAFPILKKYQAKATLFIITGAVGKSNYANWDQLMEMENSGLIDIESHTVTHPDIRKLTSKQLVHELASSKQVLEEHLHKSITIFAYPYGGYTESAISALASVGYKAAFTTKNRMTHPSQGRYTLKRLRVFQSQSFSTFNP